MRRYLINVISSTKDEYYHPSNLLLTKVNLYVNLSSVGKTVIFYRTVDGKCPVQEFLESLSGKVAQKIAWVLSLVEDLDAVPATYFKKLVGTDGIW